MKIYLGSDHGGFKLKEEFKEYLRLNHQNFVLEDCGAFTDDSADDYPPIAFSVAEKVANHQVDDCLGILLCRSGAGMVIAANKVKGVRAVEIYDEQIAVSAKGHNHANVIAFGGDQLSIKEMANFFEIFMRTPYDLDQRHLRRIEQISNYEK